MGGSNKERQGTWEWIAKTKGHFSKSLPSWLRKPCRRGHGKCLRVKGDGRNQGIEAFWIQQVQHTNECTETGSIHEVLGRSAQRSEQVTLSLRQKLFPINSYFQMKNLLPPPPHTHTRESPWGNKVLLKVSPMPSRRQPTGHRVNGIFGNIINWKASKYSAYFCGRGNLT